MSLLNALLNSIDGRPAPADTAKDTKSVAVPNPSNANIPASKGIKRKAEDDLRSPKPRFSAGASSLTGTATPHGRSIKEPQSLKTRAPLTTNQGVDLPKSAVKGIPSSSAAPKVPPKKGSFAEILARASQSKNAPVGIITHKPKEKVLTKKDILREKALAKQKSSKAVPQNDKAVRNSTSPVLSKGSAISKSDHGSMQPGLQQGKTKVPLKTGTGYQGTLKARSTVAYKGTIKSGCSSRKVSDSETDKSRMKGQQSGSRRYAWASDSEDDGEDSDIEDRYHYASEDYSDMDAGFDELEEENETAARIARLEDAKEQALLEKLKQEKDKKKVSVDTSKRRM